MKISSGAAGNSKLSDFDVSAFQTQTCLLLKTVRPTLGQLPCRNGPKEGGPGSVRMRPVARLNRHREAKGWLEFGSPSRVWTEPTRKTNSPFSRLVGTSRRNEFDTCCGKSAAEQATSKNGSNNERKMTRAVLRTKVVVVERNIGPITGRTISQPAAGQRRFASIPRPTMLEVPSDSAWSFPV